MGIRHLNVSFMTKVKLVGLATAGWFFTSEYVEMTLNKIVSGYLPARRPLPNKINPFPQVPFKQRALRWYSTSPRVVAMPVVSKPVTTDYRIEAHTTPKTIKAKALWASFLLEAKEKYAKNPKLLEAQDEGFKTHWDLRIKQPEGKKWISFALPKCHLPEQGEIVQAIQSTEGHGWHKANPAVADGAYGAGVTKVVEEGRCLYWMGRDGTRHIWFDCQKHPLVMVPINKWESCLLIGKKTEPVQHIERPFHLKDLSNQKYEETVQDLMDTKDIVVMRKYNGGGYTLTIDKGKDGLPIIHMISRRATFNDGGHVEHPDGGIEGIDKINNLMHLKFADIPKELYEKGRTQIYCEVYAEGHGPDKDTPLAYSTSVLNSHPAKAQDLQNKWGKLRIKMLDITILNGQDFKDQDFWCKLKTMETIHESCRVLRVPKYATTPDGKRALMATELSKREGVVVRSAHSNPNSGYKIKRKETFDLKIVGINPVIPTSKNSKWVMDGQIIGAGTILLENGQLVKIPTDFLKIDMFQHPEEYIGRYAEIEGQEMFESTGMIYAPVLIDIRDDK